MSLSTSILKYIRFLLAAPKYARHSQALRTILLHSTLRRLFNFIRLETEYRLRRTHLKAKPYILVVDPTNVCNLRCPLCPTGLHDRGRKGLMMQWEVFQSVIDELSPYAYKVNLFNWGESLLNKDTLRMIQYANEKGLATTLSSNLSIPLTDEQIDSLIKSDLEFLCLSIDGATQETYEIYRRMGKLDLVMENVSRILKRRNELKRKLPVLEWQFIPMKHNEHEIEQAREIADRMGVDQFRCIEVGIPFDSPEPDQLKDQWFPIEFNKVGNEEAELTKDGQTDAACYFLYRYLVVNPDAKVSPCCVVSGEKNDFGSIDDVQNGQFDTLWNNEMFVSARSYYSADNHPSIPTVCDRCNLFTKR